MEPQAIQQATDKLIPIIAAFFVAFTGLVKLWAESGVFRSLHGASQTLGRNLQD